MKSNTTDEHPIGSGCPLDDAETAPDRLHKSSSSDRRRDLRLSDDSATIQYRVRLVPTRRGDLRVVTTQGRGEIVAVVKIPARRR